MSFVFFHLNLWHFKLIPCLREANYCSPPPGEIVMFWPLGKMSSIFMFSQWLSSSVGCLLFLFGFLGTNQHCVNNLKSKKMKTVLKKNKLKIEHKGGKYTVFTFRFLIRMPYIWLLKNAYRRLIWYWILVVHTILTNKFAMDIPQSTAELITLYFWSWHVSLPLPK